MVGIGADERVGFSRFLPPLDVGFPVRVDGGEGQREEEERPASRSMVASWPEVAGNGRKIRVGSAGSRGSSALRESFPEFSKILKKKPSIYRKIP